MAIIAMLTAFNLSAETQKLRIGWQIPWSLQGQLVQV